MRDDMRDVEVGEQLGPYRLVERLGAGGMGEVWRAEHARIRSQVAIKFLLARGDESAEARFLREAMATAKMRHPGIVTVTDYGSRPDGGAYLVMELLEGETLASRIARDALTASNVAELGGQIAEALAAAHDAGVIHRDLKPANIFLVPDAAVRGGVRAKLVDFGIATERNSALAATALTATGAMIGTPLYMSPEQLVTRHGEVDHRTDLYALGVVLFEMATGRVPFRGSTLGDVIDQHMHVTPPSPRTLAPGIGVALDRLIVRLLAKDRNDRPATADHVARELAAIASAGFDDGLAMTQPTAVAINSVQTGATTLAPNARVTVPERVTASPMRLLVGLAFIALVGVISVAAMPRDEPTAPQVSPTSEQQKEADLSSTSDEHLDARCRAASSPQAPRDAARACLEIHGRELRRPQPDLVKVFGVMSIACARGEDLGCRVAAEMLSRGAGMRPDRPRAKKLAEAACATGGGQSCWFAGELALAGGPAAADPVAALRYFERSCELHDAGGCFRVSWALTNAVGTAANTERAETLAERAKTSSKAGCAKDDARSCWFSYQIEQQSVDSHDRGALDRQRACDLGDAAACTQTGVAFLNGIAVGVDRMRAATMFKRACDLGDGHGCQTYGFFLASGVLGPADVPQGFAIAKRACDVQGDRYCSGLASFYTMGLGTSADPTVAASLFERACAGGDVDSCAMTIPRQPPEDGRDESAAIGRMDSACAAGSHYGCLLSGDLALRHSAPTKAVQAYDRACALSAQEIGCVDLASMYFAGTGTARDTERGHDVLRRACGTGSPSACHALGKRYREGDGVAKQPADALRLFELACEGGFSLACLDGSALLATKTSGLTPNPKRSKELRTRGCAMDPASCRTP